MVTRTVPLCVCVLLHMLCHYHVEALVPTGLNLPAMDVPAPHYGGAWASAGTYVFMDLFKHSTPFEPQSRRKGSADAWGWAPFTAFPWRADGYPAALVTNATASWVENCAMAKIGVGAAHYPSGNYVLLYDGVGNVSLAGDATPTNTTARRIVLTLRASSGFFVRIVGTSAADPLRNIRIVPLVFELTYMNTPFHPNFVNQVKGFSVLRFAAWQRVWGDERNPQMLPRSWTARTTPSSQTQIGADGVAIEHMVQLCNTANASAWFSLPAAANDSDAYATQMARYVASRLNTRLSAYIEFGQEGPGWMSTSLATNTARLARIWRAAFAAFPTRLTVVATYANPAWIPYFSATFPADAAAAVDAIAVVGAYGSYRSWPSNLPSHYDFQGANFAHDPANAGIDLPRVLALTRSSVLHADILHNRWRGLVGAMGKKLFAVAGGPDTLMQAAYYSARQNYQSVLGCTAFPCTRSLFPPANPSSVTYASMVDRNASLPALLAAAQREYALDELLMQVKLRHNATRDHMLDHLWRWDAMDGGVFVVNLPAPARCDSGPGTRVLPPAECRAGSGITTAIRPETSPVYQAVREYQAGRKGALSLGGAPELPPVACSPSCEGGTCVKGKCVCWAGFSGPTCAVKASRPNECNTLMGLNLEGIKDWSRSWTFLDLMKSGRAWISQGLDGSGGWGNTSVALDADGWVARLGPNQRAGTMMVRDLQGHLPAGTYTVTWEGEGVIDFSMSDVRATRQLGAGLAEVDLRPSTDFNNGLFLTVERSNPANPVRNIRVLMPGYDAATAAALPFHPALLRLLASYGTLRFMDWMSTNAAVLPTTWTERPRTSHRSYAANLGGVPVETMVQLANVLGAAPWFTLPHTADEAYQRTFAQQVLLTLRTDVKVYVEWSNEVWHTGFPAGQFAQAEGLRLGIGEEGSRWYGGATNEARLCYYSERTKGLARVWREVFGADAASRLVVVAQGQSVWPITSDKVLRCRNATSFIDALAIAPYFGSFSATRDTDLATFMNVTLPSQVNATVSGDVTAHARIASQYGKKLVTYEAGQGLAGGAAIPLAANRDGGMYRLYRSYLSGLVAANVTNIMHFSSVGAFGTYGFWGLQEWMDQAPSSAPKLQAVKDFIAASASNCSTAGASPEPEVPCPLDCSGRGICLGGTCSCFTGFSGAACNVSQYTEVYNCGYKCTFDQGVCNVTTIQGTTRSWGCKCNPGFSGVTCSLFTCPKNCSWAGECVDSGVCNCYPGYMGAACDVDCGCNGHGMCRANGTCACDAGWRLGANGCEPECSGCAPGAGCVAPGECGCAPACTYGTCYNGRCECWAGYKGADCSVHAVAGQPNANSPVGMNLAGISYWTTQWVWVDVMKQSSKWFTGDNKDTTISSAFDTAAPLSLRPDGYPASLAPGTMVHKLTVRDVQLRAMPGRYVALYDGDGILEVGFDAKVASVAKGRVEFDFVPTANPECAATGAAYCGDNGIHVRVTATNPANPLRNLRVVQPGFEATAGRQPFHPWFLKSLERYSVLRFTDWMGTNTDALPPWSERTTPAHDTQARPGGVALEHIAALVNDLGAAPWVSVHHLADDAYVRALATLLRDSLRPDVKVYVEHSNEVWNAAFAQGKYARARGQALGLSADAVVAGYRYHGLRSEQIFDIFTEVWGADARAARLRFVVGTWGFVCNGGIGCGTVAVNETLSMGRLAAKADLVAVGAYFDCGLGASPANDALMSVDAMLAQCNATSTINTTRTNLEALNRLVARFGLPLTSYEAGPSTVEQAVLWGASPTPGAAEKYIALQRDQRFEGVYRSYLALFDSLGLVNATTPFMHFSSAGLPSRYGSWGLIEFTGQDPSSAPKYRALAGLLSSKLPPGPGCMDPSAAYRGLGDRAFRGQPAVLTPMKGAVWVQDVAYNVTWPRAHAPGEAVTISLFRNTDCAGAGALWTWTALTPAPAGAFLSVAAVTVPSSVPPGDAFLKIQGVTSGRTNYSDVFSLQRAYLSDGGGGCFVNPTMPVAQPPAAPPLRCEVLPWNVTGQANGLQCTFDDIGCRNFRTSNVPGNWTSIFKPIRVCTALLSPNPGTVSLATTGVPVGPLTPGAPVAASLCA